MPEAAAIIGSLELPTTRIVGFHLVVASVSLVALGWTARRPEPRRFLWVTLATLPVILAAVFLAGTGTLARLGLLSLVFLFHGPAYLVLAGGLVARVRPRTFGVSLVTIGLVGLTIGIWSVFFEPYRLEVNHYTIRSPKLTRSYTIVVVADLQASEIGPYEERALEMVANVEADLVIWAGDYLQLPTPSEYREWVEVLRPRIAALELEPLLGSYAVQGNVDWTREWTAIFDPKRVHCFPESRTLRITDDLTLTGLSVYDSSGNGVDLDSDPRFHIVVGHHPDFMHEQAGDLLIAGHTHGGQVNIPFWGPALNPSTISQTWAAGGLFERGDQHCLISRGIGMERGNAPPIRFNCPPEIVVLHLEPSDNGL